MGIREWFVKQAGMKIGFAPSSWMEAPQRNLKGYLNAYSEVYSLFGIALRIATATSEVRWRLYKGNERSERSQIAEHPILTLLDFANEFQTGQEIIELTQLYMDLGGRAFWYLPKNGLGVPAEVWALSPDRIKIIPSKDSFIAGFKYCYGGQEIPLGKDEVIWFPMPDPTNPYGGVGYAQAAAVEIDSEAFAGKWNLNFFYNSARPDAVLEYESSLTDDEFEELRKQWKQQHGGLGKAHKTAILEGGVKYVQTQMNQKEMDFTKGRRQTRENLMFAFGIPQSVMGVSENVNRANAEAGEYTFARWLIKPRLTRIKNKLNEQLLPMFPKAKGVEIDFDEVVPETVEQKKSLAESGIKSGYMSINEARKLNGLDPLKDGDQLLIPLNLIPTPTKSIAITTQKDFFPTDEQKEAYWNTFVSKTLGYERALIARLKDMFKSQEKEALSKLKPNMNLDTPLLSHPEKDYKEAAKPVLSDLLKESIDDGEELINPKPAHRSKQEDATEWLDGRLTWTAEHVAEETAKQLAKQLAQGFEAGESIPEIAKRVSGVFDNAERFRTVRIARTETIMTANEGALTGYSESKVEKVQFYAALDERTDDDCLDLHNEIFEVDDAHGMIPIHPSCRCTWLPVVE